jgi:ABC-type lipoprotein export system ATPase subunit
MSQDIEIVNVCPAFFTSVENRYSDVWGQRLSLLSGRTYAISAASGKGKSTLLNMIFGVRAIPNGDVIIHNRSSKTFSAEDRSVLRSHWCSMVFQDMQLFQHLTARENLELKNQLSETPRIEEIQDWCELLEVDAFLDRPCGQLSLGQQQRIAIVRALLQPFEWLLLDEPTSHLDEQNAKRAMDLIKEECTKRSAGCLVTTLESKPLFHYDHLLYC